MPNGKDYYKILQVHPDADPAIIRNARRTIMNELRAHPDLGGNTAKAQEINEAYETLSDPEKRRAYDQQRGNGNNYSQERQAPPPNPEPSGPIQCTMCTQTFKTPSPHRVITHLMGKKKSGGHELSRAEAEGIVSRMGL